MKTSKRYVSAADLEDMMDKKIVFFCSPAATQGSSREIKDLMILEKMKYEIISSNTPYICNQLERMVARGEHPEDAFELVYAQMIKLCALFILRAEADGNISPLTERFIKIAKREGVPILELPREFNYRRKKNEFFNSQ